MQENKNLNYLSLKDIPKGSTLFSGIQPTGNLHIGNYLGAIQNWQLISQNPDYESIFSIVDLHAITINYSPEELQHHRHHMAKVLLALNIGCSDSSFFFIQSAVPFHTQLTWLLTSVTPFGDLRRMTQFKDKQDLYQQESSAGLFLYPILMAADILLYGAEYVPVGEDQLQHLEFARTLVYRFHHKFSPEKNLFPVPQGVLSPAPRIKGLDGEKKMSKSLHNEVGLLDSPKTITEKLKKAKTDPQRIRKTDKGNPHICNMFQWHKSFTPEAEVQDIQTGCSQGTLPCVECKAKLAKNIAEVTLPIQEKYEHMSDSFVQDYLVESNARAHRKAAKNFETISRSMGF